MLNENIRFFKPNDPYYYEVDNLPLVQLLENCVDLQNQIDVLPTAEIYVVETWLNTAFALKSDFDARVLEEIEDVHLNNPPMGDTLKKSSIGWDSFPPETQNLSTAFSDVDLADAIAEQVLAFDGDKWVASSIVLNITKLEDLQDVTPPTGDNQLLIAKDGTNFKPFKWLETSSITNLRYTSTSYPPSQKNPFFTKQYSDTNFSTNYISNNENWSLQQDLNNLTSMDSAKANGARDITLTKCGPGSSPTQGTYQAANGLIIKWANVPRSSFTTTIIWDTPFPNVCMSTIVGSGHETPNSGRNAHMVLTQATLAAAWLRDVRLWNHDSAAGAARGLVLAFGY